MVRTAHPTLGSAGEAGCRMRRAHHVELAKQMRISFTRIGFKMTSLRLIMLAATKGTKKR